jgi:hypothetical protein
MKQGSSNWKRAIASPVVLAMLMVLSVGQAPAVEQKGVLSRKDVKALIANAKTPEDHMKLARHFTAKAAQHEAEAKEHEELAVEYKRNPHLATSKHPMASNTAEHCQYFAEHCRKAAQELHAVAAAHEEMAKNAAK